jgi:hypothetical protein
MASGGGCFVLMCGGLVLCAAQIRLMDLIPSVMSYFSAQARSAVGVYYGRSTGSGPGSERATASLSARLCKHKLRRPRPLLLSPTDTSTRCNGAGAGDDDNDTGLGLQLSGPTTSRSSCTASASACAPRAGPPTAEDIVDSFLAEENSESARPGPSPRPVAGPGTTMSPGYALRDTLASSGIATVASSVVTTSTSLSASIQRQRSELLRTLHSIPKAAVPRSSAAGRTGKRPQASGTFFFAGDPPNVRTSDHKPEDGSGAGLRCDAAGGDALPSSSFQAVEESYDDSDSEDGEVEDALASAVDGAVGGEALRHAAAIELMAKHRGRVLESAKGVKASWFSFEATGVPAAAMENADPLLRALNAAESRVKERLVAAVEDRSRRSRRCRPSHDQAGTGKRAASSSRHSGTGSRRAEDDGGTRDSGGVRPQPSSRLAGAHQRRTRSRVQA